MRAGFGKKALVPLFSAALLAMSAVGSAVAQAQELAVRDPWVRAMPPTQRMTAAYMTLSNEGSTVIHVTGVRAAAADASLHATRRDGDRMRMEAVPEITLQAGESVELAPGGLHVMLMGMESVPAAGESVQLCIDSSVGERCVDAPVRREAAPAQHHHDH